jgi:hypothetical protein
VPIRYSAAEVRWARIDGATRTYCWKNLAGYGRFALLLVIVVLGFVAIERIWAARQVRQSTP